MKARQYPCSITYSDWQGFPQRKDYPLEGPGELLMENPLDWLKLKQAREESEIE